MKLVSNIQGSRVINRPQASVHLTMAESCLYGILWERRGMVVPIEYFIDALDALHERTIHTEFDVRVNICRLRRKLGSVVDIGTFPKKGYSMLCESHIKTRG